VSDCDTWKSLDQTVPAADRSIQKECGMISDHWRQANERYRCASRLLRIVLMNWGSDQLKKFCARNSYPNTFATLLIAGWLRFLTLTLCCRLHVALS
jgi:hypothetical protein